MQEAAVHFFISPSYYFKSRRQAGHLSAGFDDFMHIAENARGSDRIRTPGCFLYYRRIAASYASPAPSRISPGFTPSPTM